LQADHASARARVDELEALLPRPAARRSPFRSLLRRVGLPV
jgi:hypothetical protein